MVYCFDLDLNLVWFSQMGGYTYFVSPTVYNGYVFTGANDGYLYAMDLVDGHIVDNITTFLPLGPSVIFTVSASLSTPA